MRTLDVAHSRRKLLRVASKTQSLVRISDEVLKSVAPMQRRSDMPGRVQMSTQGREGASNEIVRSCGRGTINQDRSINIEMKKLTGETLHSEAESV